MPPVVPPDAPTYERDAADLQVLSCRRTTLEWVLRRCALAEPSVRFEVGVAVDRAARRRRHGAPLDGARRAPRRRARAAGRRGRGQHRPARRVSRAGSPSTASTIAGGGAPHRHDLPRPASTGLPPAPTRRWATRAAAAPASASWWPAPTTAPTPPPSPCDADDAELRTHLMDPDRYEAVLPLFREMEPVVTRGGEPITPVQAMGGLINRIRRFVDPDGAPARPRVLRHRRRPHVHEPALRTWVVARGAPGGAGRRRARRAPRRPRRRRSRVRVGQRRHGRALVRRVAASPTWRRAPPAPDPAIAPPPEPHRPAAPRLDLQTLRRIAASGDPELSVLVAKTMSLLLTPQEVFGDPEVVRAPDRGGGRRAPARPEPAPARAAHPGRHPRRRAALGCCVQPTARATATR